MAENSIEIYRHGTMVSFKYARGEHGILPNCFHDHYELFFLLHGEAVYMNERYSHPLQPCDLVLIPPGEYHRFQVQGSVAAYERCVMEVHPALLDNKILSAAIAGCELLHIPPQDRICENFRFLCAQIHLAEEEVYSYLLQRITEETLLLCGLAQKIPVPAQENHNTKLSLAIRYIYKHLHEPFTLNDMAKECFMSPSALSHSFQQYYGISPMQYVNAKRMLFAEKMLKAGEAPGTVSERCGFQTYSVFYRAYRKFFCRSPSQRSDS